MQVHTVTVDGRRIGYRDEGEGPAVLLLHGWPTSSYLWRNVIPALAGSHRVIAPDLLGFGTSDKPLDVRYDFDVHTSVLDGLLARLGIEQTALVGHDLGGPIGLHWALANRERVTALALLNTLVYPEFDPFVMDFVARLLDPARREALTSRTGLTEVMRLGVVDPDVVTEELVDAVAGPFPDADARRALANAGVGLSVRGFHNIAAQLPELDMPVALIYGAHDRILPDVADTMARLARDLPQATTTVLDRCGHFVQEEDADQLGRLLAAFLAQVVTDGAVSAPRAAGAA